MTRVLYPLFAFFLIITACSDESDCVSGPLEVISMGDLGCPNSNNLTTISSSKEFELIRDGEQFNQVVSTTCPTNIDWDEHDMIAGTIFLQYGLQHMEQEAFYYCFNNTLEITVTAFVNETTSALPVSFAFLIPKLSNEATPFVEIVTKG